MKQLQPGLTWRLGSGGATRLNVKGMALVNGNSMLFPGEQAVNLRYWSNIRWDLVVFELTKDSEDWKWGAQKAEYGLIPAKVGKNPDPKKATKKLELELKAVTKATRSTVPVPAVTGMDAKLLDPDEVDDDASYSKAARKQFDAVPMLELHMRFGPHMGIVAFEAVQWKELKSKVGPTTGTAERKKSKARKLRLRIASHPALLARTELLEKFNGQITLGTWEDGAPEGAPVVLAMTGGELPMLWPVTRGPTSKDDVARKELDSIEGKRVVTKTTSKTVTATLKANVLTVHLHLVDYVFQL